MKMWMLNVICLVGLSVVSAGALGEIPTVATGDGDHGTQPEVSKVPQSGPYSAPRVNPAEDRNAKLEQYINACMVKRPGNNGIEDTFRRIMR